MRRTRTLALIGILLVAVLAQRSSAAPSANNIAKYDSSGNLIGSDSGLWEVGGSLGIGTSAPLLINYDGSGRALTILGGGDPGGQLELASTATDAGAGNWAGLIDFDIPGNTGNGQRLGEISAFTEGGSTNARGGVLAFFTKMTGAGAMAEGLRINSDGNTLVSGNLTTNGSTWLADLTVNGDAAVSGNFTATGNIAAKYQDVAEWVEGRGSASAGTVMVLSTTEPNVVRASDQSYDTAVAGVISGQPGIVLGEKAPGRVLISHSGRVRVKVDATFGAVHAGDLLVTSPTPGYAMRSTPMTIEGMSFHRPGTVLGKAIESLEDGRGEILVLVTLQ